MAMRKTTGVLSVARIGMAFATVLVAYFAWVVPDDLGVLLVGSALAIVFASYAPLLGVLTIGRLVGWLSGLSWGRLSASPRG